MVTPARSPFSRFTRHEVDRHTEAISLSDGRTVSYIDCGDPDGEVLFYFHGSPGSRYEGWFFDRPARTHGYRVIAPDRPGMGRSDHVPGYTLLGYTTDVAEIADALDVERFGVLGLSGGGTTALSCASALSRRVTTLGLVCSWAPVGTESHLAARLAPLDRAYMHLSRWGPGPFVPAFAAVGLAARYLSAETFTLKLLSGSLSEADRRLLSDPHLGRVLTENTRESFRTGFRGPARDAYLRYRPWGFDVASIECPGVVHHGTDDSFAPYPMGEYLASELPDATLYTYPGWGHLQFFTELETVLGSLR
jgi:pimeloyl-ACP methyl ester carboxylesterase